VRACDRWATEYAHARTPPEPNPPSLGAAAGLGLGAILNEAKKNGDVLYDARRSTTTLALAPIVSPRHKGLALTMTWR
jgi:hypothetical protein